MKPLQYYVIIATAKPLPEHSRKDIKACRALPCLRSLTETNLSMSENPENLKRELLAPLSSCYKRSSRHTTLLFVVASSIYLNFTIMHSVFDFKYFRLFVGNICVALPWNLMMKVVHRTRVMGLVS